MTYQPLAPERAFVEETPPPPPQPERGRVIELVEKVSSFAVPLAVGLYAMLYLGFQSVYEVFGITPEQAGLDQATVFARLLGTLVRVFLWLLPFAGFLAALGWLLNKATRGALSRVSDAAREKPWIAALAAAALSGAGYWAYFLVEGSFTAEALTGGDAAMLAAVVAIFGLLIPYRMMRRTSPGRAGSKVLTGVLVGVGLGFFLTLGMVAGASDIFTNGNGNAFLQMVGFKNQWAVVTDSDGKALDKNREAGDMLMLLGEQDGAYVFYDCGTQQTLRRAVEGTNLADIQLDPDFTDGGKHENPACGYALEGN